MSKITNNNDIIQELIDILQNKATNGGIDTTDATATAEDILVDKTAYVNGKKITGTYEVPVDYTQALLTNTLSTYTNSLLTNARRYAFAGVSLQSLKLPKLNSCGSSLFQRAFIDTLELDSLYELDFNFGEYARIGTLHAPNLTRTSYYWYWDNAYIQNFCWSNVTMLRESVAQVGECTIQNLQMPNLTTIGSSGFNYASIGKLSIPKLTTISQAGFRYGGISGKLCLDTFPTIASRAFYSTYLRYLSISDSTAKNFIIPASCFYSTGLQALILNCSVVVQLEASNAFSGTAIDQNSLSWVGSAARSPGAIYVPSDLVGAYQTATNWNFYSQKIQALPPENKRLYIDGKFYECDAGMTWAEWVASEYNTDGYTNQEWAIVTPDEEWIIGTYLYGSEVMPEDVIDLDLAYTWIL